MKIKITPALCWTAPLLLLVAGCNKEDSTTGTGTYTAASTNAVVNSPAGATTEADNSRQNAQDRNGTTLTAGDQGTSEADRGITQKIRQMLTSSTNDFSMTAKNVKIITDNGKVTLRGPVNTEAEKSGITQIATGVAGDGNVDDQLEVKTNP